MLSFSGKTQINKKFLSFTLHEKFFRSRFKANTMSLQVPCSPLLSILWTNLPGKRVLPFTLRGSVSASMTVEAAFGLPLFVFLAVALLMPMKVLDTQRKVQMVVEQACEELSLYAYTEESQEETLYSDVAAAVWLRGKLGSYEDSVVVKQARVPDENGDILLEVECRKKIPFFSGVTDGMTVRIAAKRHGWTGLKGKLKSNRAGDGRGESDEEMVYVGRDMGRYHRLRDCHYISNDYRAVPLEEAKTMKDADYHRLTACGTCKEYIVEGGIVYVTPNGQHYHGSTDCKAMVSYVRKVARSEVEHLGECSYCSK